MQTPGGWSGNDGGEDTSRPEDSEAFNAIELSDGTTIVEQVDVEHREDGSVVTVETEAISEADGAVIIDETVTTEEPDGTVVRDEVQTIAEPDGTVHVDETQIVETTEGVTTVVEGSSDLPDDVVIDPQTGEIIEAEEEEVDPVEAFRDEQLGLPGLWYVVHSYAGFEKR
ncbi:MAG TPA: hypothetical protein VES02_06755, partial [Dermatophilaceae bacterium]|nr:hypothetical protein [Dermatophilaceae bacterium]